MYRVSARRLKHINRKINTTINRKPLNIGKPDIVDENEGEKIHNLFDQLKKTITTISEDNEHIILENAVKASNSGSITPRRKRGRPRKESMKSVSKS